GASHRPGDRGSGAPVSDAAVAVRGLRCAYPGTARPALADLDLELARSALAVVMGASGAGKSTLARCLTRLVPCFVPAEVTGDIRLLGASIHERRVGELAGTIGMVFQDFEAQLFSTDVTQEVVFGLEHTAVPPAEMPERIARALATVGLAGFEGRDPTTLSGGEKQRLAIAGLLAMRPPVMVLGLPDAPLDVATAAERLRAAGAVPKPPRFLPPPRPGGPPLIDVRGLHHRYPTGHEALAEVSLAIRPGEFVALVGRNGSGKTTLAKHLNGLLEPTEGAVRLEGHDVRGLALEELAQRVGYVFQDPDHQLFAATVEEEVAFGPQNLGLAAAEVEARVAEALAAVGLGERDADPFLLDKGVRQRLAVAAVLALRPDLLVLDAPTTGLDFAEQQKMMALLRALHARGQTIVIITHTPWVIA